MRVGEWVNWRVGDLYGAYHSKRIGEKLNRAL